MSQELRRRRRKRRREAEKQLRWLVGGGRGFS